MEENEFLMFLKNDKAIKSEEGAEDVSMPSKKLKAAGPKAQARKVSGGDNAAEVNEAFSGLAGVEEQDEAADSQVKKVDRKARSRPVVEDDEDEDEV